MLNPRYFTIEHLRGGARSRLPKMVFEFVDGGSGTESALRRNRGAFETYRLMPNALIDARSAKTETSVFGQTYSAPFGVSPMGLCNIVSPGTDGAIASAAEEGRIPYCLSTGATTPIEAIAEKAPNSIWFQLYITNSEKVDDALIERARVARAKVLVVTVDVPIAGKRVRDLVNGLTIPLRPSPSTIVNLMGHPLWLLKNLRHGPPQFEMLARYFPNDDSSLSHAAYTSKLLSSGLVDWSVIKRIRKQWDGALVIKGILNPNDALKARELGVDGIFVSNHGGRQLDAAPSSLEMLPVIRDIVGDKMTLLIDSGIRNGDDIVKALALGADFAMLGRPFLYGVAAMGTRSGAVKVISILSEEVRNTLIHLGCNAVADVGPGHIWESRLKPSV